MGKQNIKSLTDYHRECIYQQCPYFRKCFIEKIIRKSRRAKIVISNHALTMSEISGKLEEVNSPTRYIFDEAHHLFNSADNTFCSIISGFEGEEVHRWLKGKESNLTFSHNKGLFLRIEELGLKDSFILSKVEEVLIRSSFLVKTGWLLRIKKFQPQGEMEEIAVNHRSALPRQPEYQQNQSESGHCHLRIDARQERKLEREKIETRQNGKQNHPARSQQPHDP